MKRGLLVWREMIPLLACLQIVVESLTLLIAVVPTLGVSQDYCEELCQASKTVLAE